MHQLDRDYHVRRARDEFERAQDAACETAAQAHIRLSGLHRERAERIGGPRSQADLERTPLR
jgi:hypothetical protein